MKRIVVPGLLALSLVGCGDGNPFTDEQGDTSPDTGTGTDTGTDTGNGSDPGTGIDNPARDLPPGTTSPTADSGIVRSEPTEAQGGQVGDGFATGISYDPATDQFSVDNLAFDGDNAYSRGTAVSSLGPYAVYEADTQFTDSLTGTPINQLRHRAVYGVSASGETQFAIVRTGAYIPYGFGGFVYQRNATATHDGSVTLPTTGQAVYTGQAAGLRDFNGAGGIQYTTADMEMAIDFNDFNNGSGVRGTMSNRRVFDINGNDITNDIVTGINTEASASLTNIPAVVFTIGPGVLDANGEIVGEVTSNFVNNNGQTVNYETGNYYAIISGDNADEVVGVIVATSSIGGNGATVRDTSGFIVLR
ncbi:hypothetical protein [Tateyamaria sp. ANG-S1]|uniref:hypothetical protein n=1 Tax=Tateyamaria sp. ANG-S1 TaxID=1577905 RepID=UPI000580ABFB|nr:hypothetical protein [Tateyamaria sp. ANG-S1]KIC50761.1 hypothetical protein RA29_02215 [Tateyamaria sp. ANG-S1]